MALQITPKKNPKCPCPCHYSTSGEYCVKCLFKWHTGGNLQKPYENVERDWYMIGNRRLFFRSKMEANIALYLDWLKKTKGDPVEWWYEKDTFVFEKILFGVRSYKVDFTLLRPGNTYEYWECKGFMDKKSRTKLKRMKIYFPDKKIVLIGPEEYKALSKWRNLLKWY